MSTSTAEHTSAASPSSEPIGGNRSPWGFLLLGAGVASCVARALFEAVSTPLAWACSVVLLLAAAVLLLRPREPVHLPRPAAPVAPAAPAAPAPPLGDFTQAPVLAHEIRNPLTAAVGRLDLMLDDPQLNDAQRNSLTTALRGVERASGLIADFLTDPQGWQPGRIHYDRDPVDLSALLSEAMQEYAPLAKERQISISLDATSPMLVRGDSQRLRQVFDNLLSNAVKYNEENGWVDIRLWASTQEDGERAELEMTNPGVTLSAEEQETAFDEHVRGDGASHVAEGFGIGLSVVDDVVRAHQGHVTLTSDDVSHATQIRVSLPFSSTV